MLIFQSTLPREKRLLQQYLSHFQLLFQSTLPREKRRNYATTGDIPTKFQSTLPREERPERPEFTAPSWTFQSTLPREERQERGLDFFEVLRISIHAPTRGATYCLRSLLRIPLISIHAPTRGATINITNHMNFLTFQSTLPREERQQYCTKNLFIFIQYRQ